jgi:hypothetical protein
MRLEDVFSRAMLPWLREKLGIKAITTSPKLENAPIQFGDRVRMAHSPETEELGVAGKVGQVYGQTTPSSSGVEVVGNPAEDYAIQVDFDDDERTLWFAEQLVEFVDHNAGSTMTIGSTTLVRTESGDWVQQKPD